MVKRLSEIAAKRASPLMIMALLSGVEEADFLYLLNATEMNKGTLSSHLSRLEEEGYIRITKTFKGKFPRTICRLLPTGRSAFEKYRKVLRASL